LSRYYYQLVSGLVKSKHYALRKTRLKEEIAHRREVTRYYRQLFARFGGPLFLRHLPQIRKIVWTDEGLRLVTARTRREDAK